MANDYYTKVVSLPAGTRARGSDVETAFTRVEAGFDLLPDPRVDLLPGFDEQINIPDGTDTTHAATKGQMDTAIGTYTANRDANGYTIINLATPTASAHPATKAYVDTWTANRDAGGYKLNNLADGTANQDACTVAQAYGILALGASPGDVPITSLQAGTATDGERIRISGTSVVGQQISASATNGAMAQNDVLDITHDAVATANRFERIVQVMEETVGSTVTDATMDWETANDADYDETNCTYGASSVTPTTTAQATAVPVAAHYIDTSLWESINEVLLNYYYSNGLSSDSTGLSDNIKESQVIAADSTHAICAYIDSGDDLEVIATAVSGGALANGTAVELYAVGVSDVNIAKFSTGKFLAMSYTIAGAQRAYVVELSGATITANSAASDGTNRTSWLKGNLHQLDTDKALLTGRNLNTGNYPFARVVTHTGSSPTITPVFGTVSELSGVGAAYSTGVASCVLSATTAAIIYVTNPSGYDIDIQTMSISGSTVTFDSNEIQLSTGDGAYADVNLAAFDSTYLLAYYQDQDTDAFTLDLISFSGGTLTVEDTITLPTLVNDAGTWSTSQLIESSSTEIFISTPSVGLIGRITRSGSTITLEDNNLAVGRYDANYLHQTSTDNTFCLLDTSYGVVFETYNYTPGADVSRFTLIGRDTDLYTNMTWAVSFDDYDTWSVLDQGAKRDIASSLSSVHGGTDGVWYYRNGASTWTAAPSDTSLSALHTAFGYTANLMSSRYLTGTAAATLGWTKNANGKMRIGIGMKTQTEDAFFDFKVSHETRSQWVPVYSGYTLNLELEDKVKVTKTSAGTESVKAVVMLP